MSIQITHVAYADESHYTEGRFRAVSMLSGTLEVTQSLASTVQDILKKNDVDELKYAALKKAKVKNAAIAVTEQLVKVCNTSSLRVDVLVWDMEDTRHSGRLVDNIENLQRMYHHLFKAVLRKRWPDNAHWLLKPDTNLSVSWGNVEYFLKQKEIYIEEEKPSLFNPDSFNAMLKTAFKVHRVEPVDSKREVLVQVADLIAGLGVKSRASFNEYMAWYRENSKQPTLFPNNDLEVTVAEQNRFEVIRMLRRYCKQVKNGVGLKSCGGFLTRPVNNPISFWLWQPQGAHDKAPIRGHDGRRNPFAEIPISLNT